MGSAGFHRLRVGAAQTAVVPCSRQRSILHPGAGISWFQKTLGTLWETLLQLQGWQGEPAHRGSKVPKPVCSGTEALGSLESLQRLSHVSVAEEHLNFLCQPMLGHDLVVFPGVLPCQNVHSSGILSGPAQKGPWFFQQDLVECRALLKAILVLDPKRLQS